MNGRSFGDVFIKEEAYVNVYKSAHTDPQIANLFYVELNHRFYDGIVQLNEMLNLEV